MSNLIDRIPAGIIVWILIGGILIALVTSISIDTGGSDTDLEADVQPIDCVPSHDPTGYGPDDAY